MTFDTVIADGDCTQTTDGLTVVVDVSSSQLLRGATLDFSDGLQSGGFRIVNPNAQRSCGCGQSFS
jgi:iron-sulfur cluster assembly protein/iron-sulfur cluster insertion protein